MKQKYLVWDKNDLHIELYETKEAVLDYVRDLEEMGLDPTVELEIFEVKKQFTITRNVTFEIE